MIYLAPTSPPQFTIAAWLFWSKEKWKKCKHIHQRNRVKWCVTLPNAKGYVTQPLHTICAYSTYEIWVLRGYTWENWEELRSLREIFTDVSRMNHVKTTEETLKTTNEMRKIHVKNEWIAYKSLIDRACITNYLRASRHDLHMLGGNQASESRSQHA